MKCKMSWKLVLLCILKIDVSWLTLQIEVLHHGSWSVLQYSLLDQARGHQYWQLDLQTALSFLHCHSLRQFSHWGGQTVLWRPNQLSGNEIPKNPPKNPIYSHFFIPFYLHNFWTTMQITLFENYSKCRIWIFYFGIFYQFLSYYNWIIWHFPSIIVLIYQSGNRKL